MMMGRLGVGKRGGEVVWLWFIWGGGFEMVEFEFYGYWYCYRTNNWFLLATVFLMGFLRE